MVDPNASGGETPAPLIMTALLDARSFDALDGLRRRYFPAAINLIPAHLTLFHHLPGDELRPLSERIAALCARTGALPFTIAETRSLGRGAAFAIDCAPLVALRAELAGAWRDRLTAQDRQGFRPHVTVQNKVGADEARATRARLDALLPMAGTIEGLALWHYRGGPWEGAGTFRFQG